MGTALSGSASGSAAAGGLQSRTEPSTTLMHCPISWTATTRGSLGCKKKRRRVEGLPNEELQLLCSDQLYSRKRTKPGGEAVGGRSKGGAAFCSEATLQAVC